MDVIYVINIISMANFSIVVHGRYFPLSIWWALTVLVRQRPGNKNICDSISDEHLLERVRSILTTALTWARWSVR